MPKAKRAVFSDTGPFYAFIDKSDEYHKVVVGTFQKLEEDSIEILTSNFVIAETHALILSRLGRDLAAKWLENIFGYAKIIRITKEDEIKAREIVLTFKDKDFSYTDATSFTLMERLKIKTAFTLDSHFMQYGKFVILPEKGLK